MNTLQKAIDVLAGAERSLAELASQAAKETNYDLANELIDLAREVGRLGVAARQGLPSAVGAATADTGVVAREGPPPARGVPLTSRTRGRPKKGEYPKFLREGDTLVKIAWSPSEKAQYEHKSPKKVLPLLAAAISKVGSNGKRFTMQSVLPLVDALDAAKIPDYQAYL
jgi:hypothetical protein